MDKYEFNIKVEQMRKLVNKSDFETAMKIADTIDWKKVRNANLLSMVAQIYEKNGEYQDAKDILLLAFERAPIGKRLLYKLTELALKEGNLEEAEAYYREFCDLVGDDPRQYLLRYMILKQKGAPVEQLIHSLESYTAEELDEKWLYELAELYHEAGDAGRCVSTCDRIMLMFGLGKYVEKAMELKLQHAPLTRYQMDLVENREKYEEKLRAVEQSFEEDEDDPEETEVPSRAVVETVNVEPEEEVTAVPEVSYEKETIVAAVKQAEIEQSIAEEVSRLHVVPTPDDESDLEKTRVLSELKRAALEADAAAAGKPVVSEPVVKKPVVQPTVVEELEAEEDTQELPKMTNHLMIEARTPEKGLELAIQTLKQIQEETGTKNPVAKITGSKLNKRGVLASAAKLAGKDLIVEEAGDLSPEMLKELEKMMVQDTSGMRIVLVDNPKQMEMLHAQNPSLADKFECIGCDYPKADTIGSEAGGKVPAASVSAVDDKAPVTSGSEAGGKASAASVSAVDDKVEAQEVDDRPVRRVVPVRDGAMRAPAAADMHTETTARPADEEELDIDEFAQYACKYASEIDCSITGKSMLALYERIEIMEEDGIPLTHTTAEDLIEEAADRAEKPSIGKAIKGLFSSKYDKDGLLILKEEHFI